MVDRTYYNGSTTITLLRLVVMNPDRFYKQDWYYDEEFANIPLDIGYHRILVAKSGGGPSTVAAAWLSLRGTEDDRAFWSAKYVWTSDIDRNGDRVYVGGGGQGKGFQIHRHLLNPKVLEVKYKFD